MRSYSFKPSGINRQDGILNPNSGACDDIINLRPYGNTLRPTMDKEIFATSVALIYSSLYTHTINGSNNYIGVRVASSTSYIDLVSINASTKVITKISEILSISGAVARDIDIKFIGSSMIISCSYNNKLYEYNWKNNAYQALPYSDLPDISLNYVKKDVAAKTGDVTSNSDFTLIGAKTRYNELSGYLSPSVYTEDVISGLSYLRHSKNNNESEGFVAVCANFELFDGSCTKPTQPVWFYLGGHPTIIFGSSSHQYSSDLHINMSRSSLAVNISGLTHGNDTLQQIYTKYKDYIKRINIYSTMPKSIVDIEGTFTRKRVTEIQSVVDKWVSETASSSFTSAARISNDSIIHTSQSGGSSQTDINYTFSEGAFEKIDFNELGKEAFYLQKSIEFTNSVNILHEIFNLDFSDKILGSETIKIENSGYINRSGKIDVYNNRLHLFDTTNILDLPSSVNQFARSIVCNGYDIVNIGSTNVNDTTTVIKAAIGNPSNVSIDSVQCKATIRCKTDNKILSFYREFNTFSITTTETTTKTLYAFVNSGSGVRIYTKISPESEEFLVGIPVFDALRNNIGTINEITMVGDTPKIKYSGDSTNSYSRPSNPSEYDIEYSETSTHRSHLLFRSIPSIIDSRIMDMDVYFKSGNDEYKVNLVFNSGDNLDSSYSYPTLSSGRLRLLYYYLGANTSVQNNRLFQYGYIGLSNGSVASGTYDSITSAIEDNTYYERDVIAVSKLNNPMVFDPSNNYRIGGNVIALSINTIGLSDVQIGQYPMTVFTDNGIYSLSVGSGGVLYDSCVKISDLVCEYSQVVNTKIGTAFISNKGLYVLVGRNATKISGVLEGDSIHIDTEQFEIAHCRDVIDVLYEYKSQQSGSIYGYSPFRSIEIGEDTVDILGEQGPCVSYVSEGGEEEGEYICVDDSDVRYYATTVTIDPTYDLSSYIRDDFRSYIGDSFRKILAYDDVNNEIIISKNTGGYSYVYNIDGKMWYKSTFVVQFANKNYFRSNGNGSFLYLNKEKTTYPTGHLGTLTFLMSRVIKMDSDFYKTIYRAMAQLKRLCVFSGEDPASRMYGFYIWASRDLQSWNLAGYRQVGGEHVNMIVKKCSPNYKYFVVTLVGYMNRDSEIDYVQFQVDDNLNTKIR